MLEEILCFGKCSCISFSSLQLASFCQNKQSIKRLLQLGCNTTVFKFQRLDLSPAEVEDRTLCAENCHSDQEIVLSQIIYFQHILEGTPCIISLLYKRFDHDNNSENTAECLDLLLNSYDVSMKCFPDFAVMKQKCICNAFIQGLVAYKLVPSIYMLLSRKCSLPKFSFIIGDDQIACDTLYSELEHSAIYVAVFYDSIRQKYCLELRYDYAHQIALFRPLFAEVDTDLETLLGKSNVQSILQMLSVLYPTPKFEVRNAHGAQILKQLSNLHAYFRQMKTLSELTKCVINQSIVAPYSTNVMTLSLPLLIKDHVALK